MIENVQAHVAAWRLFPVIRRPTGGPFRSYASVALTGHCFDFGCGSSVEQVSYISLVAVSWPRSPEMAGRIVCPATHLTCSYHRHTNPIGSGASKLTAYQAMLTRTESVIWLA